MHCLGYGDENALYISNVSEHRLWNKKKIGLKKENCNKVIIIILQIFIYIKTDCY